MANPAVGKYPEGPVAERASVSPRRGCARIALLLLGAAIAHAQSLEIDGSIPYAFHRWNTAGTSADVGASFGRDFLGLKLTYFNPKPVNVYPGVGSVQVDQQVEALLIAYRHNFPLARFGVTADYVPLELYLGAAAGLGRVKESLANTPAVIAVYGNQLTATNTELTGELFAGLQYNFGPHFGLKAGYRYIDSFNNVRQFGADTNTDTKTLEFGVVLRL